MADVSRDLSPASLVRAIEYNAAELLMEMGRVGGGEQRDEPGLRWTIGGSPVDYHNCVVHASLDESDADAAVQESLERLRARDVSGTWHVGPSMRPADLGERLVAAGFSLGGSEPGMAADLQALNEDQPAPAALTIERVVDEESLTAWGRTLATGFGEGEREATWVAGVYRRIGLGDTVPWRHYLARLGDRPVGTSTLFLGAGVAGVYFVMTVPDARRRGIGAAVTLAALRDARALGFRIGVLSSSEAGRPVYARLGFGEYCTISMYEWAPPVASAPSGPS